MHLNDIQESIAVESSHAAQSSFVNVNLSRSRFDDVDLRHTTFTNVNLSNVALDDVNLTGASISNANLAGVTVNGISIQAMMRAYRDAQARREERAGAVLYAKHVERLRAFYERVLGLAAERTAHDHVILGSPAFQLVVVEVPASIAATIELQDPPRLRPETPIKLALRTPSIAAVRETAPRYGGVVLPADREWDFDGARVCDGSDPEGNVFQLREQRA